MVINPYNFFILRGRPRKRNESMLQYSSGGMQRCFLTQESGVYVKLLLQKFYKHNKN